MSMRFISAMIEMTCHVNHFFFISSNDVISLESRPWNFGVVIHAYSLRPQTHFRLSLTRVTSKSIDVLCFELGLSGSGLGLMIRSQDESKDSP